ncbi:type IV pilus secretin PilQ [Deltaproteobacteria bacterium OttesenSCG-928-M10]|nr:type IV pilus secretin PilQ [Deltaproteobacteria bacterium OttesenSCG-928-M10]
MNRNYLILAMFFTAALMVGARTVWAQGSFAPAPEEPSMAGATTEVSVAPEQPVSEVDLSAEAPLAVRYDAPKIYTGERISLDFQNADIHNIIRIIGEISGKNIVVSDAVSGKVTLKLKDVPWDQALDIVLSSRNLGVEESGNVLTIYDLPTLQGIQAGRQRIAAERAAAAAQAPLTKKVFTPKYAPIGMVAGELTKIKSSRGKIVSIGNDIYVEDDPGTLASMTQIFMRIDRVARQILIEARIIEATSSFIENIGVNWNLKYDGGGLSGAGTPGKATGSIDIAKGATLGFGFLNKANSLLLNANISASETSSEARTISAPRIMAANDQEVSIKQGKQIPYKSGSSATTAANVQFKDVVMELKVKPHIEENGRIVTLDIKLTNDTPDASSGTNEEPAINTREAETKLMVKDGETVVIGGIIVDNQSTAYDRVPGVHRIPILGWLFQERGISNDKSEMLIFITANIIPINI